MRSIPALAASLCASAVATGLMFWARAAYQVRTLPERLMEWALLYVPPEQFEAAITRFGTSAKTLALNGATAGMLVLLVALGALAVRAGLAAVLLTAGGLWLFAMAVVMPLTGAGLFATGLFADVRLTNASYFALAAAYATVLLLARRLAPATPATSAPADPTRRALLGAALATLSAYALTLWLGRDAGSLTSDLPLATVDEKPAAAPAVEPATTPTASPAAPPAATAPSPSPSLPLPNPGGAGVSPESASTAPRPPATAPAGTPASPSRTPPLLDPGVQGRSPESPSTTLRPPAATPSLLPPNPQPKRTITRNDDGSTTASGRQPGTLAKLITPIPEFYITTKNAAGDPVLDGPRWRMLLDGEVSRPVQVDLPTIRRLPPVTLAKTLECISNRVTQCEEAPFGCDLISTAEWRGVKLADVLSLAGGLKPGARSLAVFGADEFSASVPADPALIAETVLVYEMNGETLPTEHGYPLRMLVPNRYGMKSAKWVVGIRATRDVYVDWYGARSWSKEGIVEAMTRVDVPANGSDLAPGEQKVAGIAYAGSRGVQRVEFSADGGATWRPARLLEPAVGKDAWVRWEGVFTLQPGKPAELTARCVDGAGDRQVEQYRLVQPDGQTGLHAILVKPRV